MVEGRQVSDEMILNPEYKLPWAATLVLAGYSNIDLGELSPAQRAQLVAAGEAWAAEIKEKID